MFLIYSYDGHLLAVSRHNLGHAVVTGDTGLVNEMTHGSSLWTDHSKYLHGFDDGTIRTVVLPDSDTIPDSFDAALDASREMEKRNSIDRDQLTSAKFNFVEYPGFGSVGPLIIESSAEVAHAYLAHQANEQGHKGFDAEWEMLNSYYRELKAAPYGWEKYLQGWRDDLEIGDYVAIEVSERFHPSGKMNHSLLVQLGHEIWVSFENFEDYRELPNYTIRFIDVERYPSEAATLIAIWIEENGGSVAAALAEDDDFGYTGSENDEVQDLFDDYYSETTCIIDCASLDSGMIYDELRMRSEDFALTELMLNPEEFGTTAHRDALDAMKLRIREKP